MKNSSLIIIIITCLVASIVGYSIADWQRKKEKK